jgi:L-arabinokinase
VIEAMGRAYAATTLALRLPFPGGFETMPRVIDIPLIARTSRLGRERARFALDLPSGRPIVLASFGGHGARLPYDTIADESGATLVLTDYETASSPVSRDSDRLRCFTSADLERRGVEYPDLVAAADIVASKPGYGIVSECIANGAALLYTSRGAFAEYPIMVKEMARHMRTGFIAQEDIRAGRWGDAIRALLAKPPVTPKVRLDGVAVAVEHVMRTVS